MPSVVEFLVGCIDTSDVGCLIRVCVPCHFDQIRSAPVVQRSALRTGRCWSWPSQMGKCSKDGSNRNRPVGVTSELLSHLALLLRACIIRDLRLEQRSFQEWTLS